MATYKVIQDIEAEDKLVGPLTLKQFIYAGVATLCLYICFLGLSKHFPYILAIFLPIALVTGFFAFPFGKDQPTETWALAKIRFMFKPRRRVWDQSGQKDLVSITAPKQVITNYTNGLTPNEVTSRLKALADTIDSRGWAIKNINVNLYSQPSQLNTTVTSDRLINPASLPQAVPSIDITASDDIMDETASPVAQHFEQMIEASEKAHRQHVVQSLQLNDQSEQISNSKPNDYWFMNEPSQPTPPGYVAFQKSQIVAPGENEDELPTKAAEATPEEKALAKKIEADRAKVTSSYSHIKTLQPLSEQSVTSNHKPPNNMTSTPDPAILGLANNNDRSVDSLAREANRNHGQEPPEDEVVVTLH